MRKSLSPNEKSYYQSSYTIIEITHGKIKEIENLMKA